MLTYFNKKTVFEARYIFEMTVFPLRVKACHTLFHIQPLFVLRTIFTLTDNPSSNSQSFLSLFISFTFTFVYLYLPGFWQTHRADLLEPLSQSHQLTIPVPRKVV